MNINKQMLKCVTVGAALLLLALVICFAEDVGDSRDDLVVGGIGDLRILVGVVE